jgi:hypothetical protein
VFRRGLSSLRALALSTLLGSVACEERPRAYAQINLKHDETRIQMYTILELPSESDCEPAFKEFMGGFTSDSASEGWRETERSCDLTLDPMYQNVMDRGTFHATYLAFKPTGNFEYEGRLVLYGIPSSQAQEICNDIAADVGKKLGVDAECIQGTIG